MPKWLLLGAAAFVSLSSAAATSQQNYDWSATLVSFDKASKTAVLQARVESYAHIEGLDEFSDGDRLILSWTGRMWAAGIRDLSANPKLMPGTLSLPVEFVSSERDGQYINFRIQVPAGSVDTLAGMDPGTRVTGISPKMATAWGTGVTSLRNYNDIGKD
jgi:hypothetical protein